MPCNVGSRSNRTARRGHDVTVPSSKGSKNTGSVKKQPAVVSNNQQACPTSVARMVLCSSNVLYLHAGLLQHMLDELPHLRRTEGFAQTGYLSLFEKRARFLTQRISGEEN